MLKVLDTAVKIVLCTPGRLHIGDLARELSKYHDITIHSYCHDFMISKIGVSVEDHVSSFWSLLPLVIVQRSLRARSMIAQRVDLAIMKKLDEQYAALGEFGDVFVAASGVCVRSLERAKESGAIVILERGSEHILEQKRLLSIGVNGSKTPIVCDQVVERELQGYEIADIISIPTEKVRSSFLRHGMDAQKLFVNPYGVDTSTFKRNQDNVTREYDIIFVGTWCWRKGSDMLLETCKKLRLRGLHVGAIGDLDPDKSGTIKHIGVVRQRELPKWYAKAKLFVLPSREDGYSVVINQAVACGLKVVASENTGSSDLKRMLELSDSDVKIFKTGDRQSLEEAVSSLLRLSDIRVKEIEIDKISWEAYGRRYKDKVEELMGK